MKKIIINSDQWQTRVAIIQDSDVYHLYFDQHLQRPIERAYFKGKVSKVLPGIQTAFVDIGQSKAGFLHISELDRDLAFEKIFKYVKSDEETLEQIESPKIEKAKVDISNVLNENDTILVQVCKEPVYEKGPKLTTCFTVPGRFLVLMPNIPKIGISKKIEDGNERQRLRSIIRENLPESMGAIIRTSAEGASVKSIQQDILYLSSIWKKIELDFKKAPLEAKLYEDLDLVLQIVRDHLDEQIEAIIVDNEAVQVKIYQFIRDMSPEFSHIVRLYTGHQNIFDHFNIEKQIQSALDRKVHLKCGGSLIIETTEAMTVIDVNTGKFTGKSNMEETIVKTNIEAAYEIARQLRLRNIGGLIVIDFIDMATYANKQKVFKTFEKVLKEQDKFQSVVLKISEFGLVQMTRKRSGKTLMQQLMHNCTSCNGLGAIKSFQTLAYDIFRHLKCELLRPLKTKAVTIQLHGVLFDYITKNEYKAILELEKMSGIKIMLATNEEVAQNHYLISCE